MIFKRITIISLALIFILVVSAKGKADQHINGFDHADAINQSISKRYTVSPGGGYELHVDIEAKIMNYKGKKDRSDFRIPYNSAFQTVKIDKAFTTLPSGKILKVGSREIQDILDPETGDSSIFSKARLKVINFPGVEIGSTISISFTVISKLGFWAEESFRLADPTVQKQVTISMPDNPGSTSTLDVSLNDPLVSFRKQEKEGKIIYSWVGRRLPKQYSEAQAPALENQPFCLLVSRFNSWSEVANFFKGRFKLPVSVQAFKAPSWAVKPDPDKLYENLLNNIAVYDIDLFQTDLIPQSPITTLKKGYGSSLDLAVLFHYLLKQQRIKSALVLANTDGVFIEPLMHSFYPALFNQVLVRCRGRFYCFVDRNMPPGVNEAEGSLGLDLSNGRLIRISGTSPNQKVVRLAAHLSPERALDGRCDLAFSGVSTADVRDQLRNVSGRELDIKVSEILHQIDPIAKLAGKFKSKGVSTLKRKIELTFPFLIDTPVAYSGGSYFLPLPDSDLLGPMRSYVPERHYGLAIPTARQEKMHLELILPPGLTLALAPKDSKGRFGPLSWDIKGEVAGHRYTYDRSISLDRAQVPANQVPELLQKICELISIQNRLLTFHDHRLNMPIE